MTDFDTDPEALAWAREKIQLRIDRYRRFEMESLAAGRDSQLWRGIATMMQRDLIGGEGCLIAAFDERLPQYRATVARSKTVVVAPPEAGSVAVDWLEALGGER